MFVIIKFSCTNLNVNATRIKNLVVQSMSISWAENANLFRF